MKKPEREKVLQSIEKFCRHDPELYEELTRKASVPADESFPLAEQVADVLDEIDPEPEREGGAEASEVTAYERRVAESVVRPNARPVLVIRNNRVTTEFLGPNSPTWAARIDAARAVLDAVIPSIGRVELKNNPDFSWVGTGWLVADDVIVTNRHVAREFGRTGSPGFVFRLGPNGGPQSAHIDFLEEFQRRASMEFTIESILWIASPNEADVAYLRVKRPLSNRPLPRRIPLAESVSVDDFVVTIGYPARDPRVPDQQLVKRIFGDVYEKKRLAPGQITEVGVEDLQHDCSTLGGNSGSPVISLKTGEAVGLHFSGLFLESNFAVPAPKVLELLQKVQRAELPGMGRIEVSSAPNGATPVAPAPVVPAVAGGTHTFQFQIPVEITVKVGGIASPGGFVTIPGDPASSGAISFEDALRAARKALAAQPDIIEVRLGYRFKRGWITDERVIVVEVRKKLSFTELRETGKPMIPPQFLGVGVDVRTAALFDQLGYLGVDLAALEARARPGAYREPPNLSLDPVKEPMKAVFHISPDSGFPNLRGFLGRVRRRLTATMYEWEAAHISDAVEGAIDPGQRKLKMVTQRQGTHEAVDDMKNRLQPAAKFAHMWASVGGGRLIPSAYHIKVASRDGEEFWLSSGNWKDSNQPNIDPAGENSRLVGPLRQRNRDWHAIIKNDRLATLFQKYIEWDFKEAKRVPVEEGLDPILPDVFVPEEAFAEGLERRINVAYLDPLVVDRELEVHPLLTPDRDARGRPKFLDVATALIQAATRKIYLQNQSFNLLDDNVDEFEQFFGVLRDKQQAGLDVRIIFRDAREFGSANGPRQQKLLERLKDFGFDTDFIRVQMRCHTKGIVVDPPDSAHPDSGEVLFGSHNLTNEGALYNRDASLLVRDAEVTAYFEKAFLFDWEMLATQEADELVGGVRLALPGEETPVGFRRVSLNALLGMD